MTSKLSNKFPIPERFPEILHDFAKEVVRAQPLDIFEFAIQYFKNLERGSNVNNLERGCSNTSELLSESADVGFKTKSGDNMNKYDIVSEGEREKNEENGMNKTNSNFGSQSNSTQREFVVRRFVDDVFKKSEDFGDVRQDESDENESERRDVEESDENEGVIGNEEEIAKEFVIDILKKSGDNIMKEVENETDNVNVEESESDGVKGNEDEIAKMFVGDILKKSGENINDMMKEVDNGEEEVSELRNEENENENEPQSQEQNHNNEEEEEVEYQDEENEQNEEEN